MAVAHHNALCGRARLPKDHSDDGFRFDLVALECNLSPIKTVCIFACLLSTRRVFYGSYLGKKESECEVVII